MASISKNADGSYRLLFIVEGKRHAIRFPKGQKRSIESACSWVERLVHARKLGVSVDAETLTWLGSVDDAIYERLVRADLVRPRVTEAEAEVVTMQMLLDAFKTRQEGMAANTIRNDEQTAAKLLEFFKPLTPIESITANDALRYRSRLEVKKYATATVAREVKRAKQVFTYAVRQKWLVVSPFADVKAGSQTNHTRKVEVPQATVAKVLDACPDVQWRLIVGFCRYAGLRCPSEVLAITWADVNWSTSTLSIPNVKTLRHSGSHRTMPILAELRPILEEAFEQAAEGSTNCITRYRESNINLRTQLQKICRRAGVPMWSKPFHNMRATLQTELADEYGAESAARWLGNTPDVARDHYLMDTEQTVQRAATEGISGAGKATQEVTQKVTQHTAAMPCRAAHEKRKPPRNAVSPVLEAHSFSPRGGA